MAFNQLKPSGSPLHTFLSYIVLQLQLLIVVSAHINQTIPIHNKEKNRNLGVPIHFELPANSRLLESTQKNECQITVPIQQK